VSLAAPADGVYGSSTDYSRVLTSPPSPTLPSCRRLGQSSCTQRLCHGARVHGSRLSGPDGPAETFCSRRTFAHPCQSHLSSEPDDRQRWSEALFDPHHTAVDTEHVLLLSFAIFRGRLYMQKRKRRQENVCAIEPGSLARTSDQIESFVDHGYRHEAQYFRDTYLCSIKNLGQS
jgi:hypothetical protein